MRELPRIRQFFLSKKVELCRMIKNISQIKTEL